MSQENAIKNLFNPKILKICREQMALSIDEVNSKASLKTLSEIEKGERVPTLKQVDRLSELYLVPPWVFTKSSLPDEYNFGKIIPSFRTFKKACEKNFDYKARLITAKVEGFRKTIINLREAINEPALVFTPPISTLNRYNISDVSRAVLDWLGTGEKSFSFSQWRKKIENKGVFIFVTSPLSSWSKVDSGTFRGLSIYHEKLPIIIINGSDAYKAKSFTLFHELGHLLTKKTMFDKTVGEAQSGEERICDNFAGEVLMPEHRIRQYYDNVREAKKASQRLEAIDAIANKFKVSTYATLVRLKNLNIVEQSQYREVERLIIPKIRQSMRSDEGGIPRNMPNEIRTQYGKIYSETVMQAYFEKQITLHKARNMFGLKKVDHLLKMMKLAA